MTSKINILFFFSFAFLALYLGKFVFLPLFFSIFFFIILKSLAFKILSIKIFKYYFNYTFSFFLVLVIFLFLLYSVSILLESNIASVLNNSELYQKNLYNIFEKIKVQNIDSFQFSIKDITDEINFTKIFSKILNTITNFAGNFSLVFLYLIFLIMEESFFLRKITKIFPKISDKKILSKINNEIFNYFQIKTFTSFLTGILTFLTLFFFNSDLSIFFGITAFLLNFIPFIGSLISIVLPFMFSLIQFLDLFQSVLILTLLIIIQIFVGNFIEPKLIGKSLNLSPIVMLITLSIMGKIWGLSGMFLSIPILVVLLIIFGNFKSGKKIAIFLSEKGQII